MKTIDLLTDNKALLTYINSQSALTSFLYDIDRLPEQLKPNTRQWYEMMMLTIAFKKGKEDK